MDQLQAEEIGRAATSVLLLLSFRGYVFIISRFGRIMSWFVPVACTAGIGLVLFWGALLDIADLTADLILAGGLACFVAFVIYSVRGKVGRMKWNMGRFCFLAGTAVFSLLSLNLKLLHYDNFSHWALIVKYLLCADRLPGADTAMIPFRDYPPGSSLFIYYVCRFAGHSQGIMILAQNSMIFACFYAVFGIVKEKRRFLLYSFLGAGCAISSYLNLTIRINNLLVDFLLPLLGMASVSVTYRHREEQGRLCILQMMLLGFTVIVKSTGAFFAGVAGAYTLWTMIRYGAGASGGRGINFMRGLLMAAGAALPALAWQYHLHTALAGFEGKFGQWLQESTGKAAAEYGAPAGKEFYGQITEDFLRAVFDPSGRAAQMLFLCTVLAAGAVLYAWVKKKRRRALERILPAAVLMTVLYYAGMHRMYLYSMPAQEAVRLAGFERYACSITVLYAGVLLMGATVDMEHSFAVDIDERGGYRAFSSPAAKRKYQYAVLGTFILGANFLYSEFNGLCSIRAEYETSLPGQAEGTVGDNWYESGKTDERKYLIVVPAGSSGIANREIEYVYRYFLWAPYVEVTDSLSEANTEAYDRIIVTDRSSDAAFLSTDNVR